MRATENKNGIPPTELDTAEGGELDFSSFMDGLVDDVKGYVHAQKHYLTLHATEKASTLMGKAVEQTVLFGVLGISLLFLNVALAFYLGDLLASRPLGFVIVAVFYLLLLGAFFLWWKNGARDRFVLDRINDLNDDN
jgi:Putative Actinobacterial Holin-X, holin superfamily III